MEKRIYKEIINGLRDFLKYLTSIWGILSVFTPLFPLFNWFNVNLPLPHDYPNLFKAVAVLTGLFVIFYRFTHRYEGVSEQPRIEFFKAIGIIIVYLSVLPLIRQSGNDFLFIIFNISNPLSYILIFYWLTNSFTILAVREMDNRKYNGNRPFRL